MTGAVTQLYRAFPIKDMGLVGWSEVLKHYSKYEHLFAFELLEKVMARGGFTMEEWTALQGNDITKVRVAFNWYAQTLLASKPERKSRGVKKMSEAAKAEDTGVGDGLNIKVIERIEKFGAGTWEVMHKESSKADGWSETTKVHEVEGVGVLVKVTTTKEGLGITNTVTFIPGVAIVRSTDNNSVVIGRHLAPMDQVRDMRRQAGQVEEEGGNSRKNAKGKAKAANKVKAKRGAKKAASHKAKKRK
jgi:hypothetical protein